MLLQSDTSFRTTDASPFSWRYSRLAGAPLSWVPTFTTRFDLLEELLAHAGLGVVPGGVDFGLGGHHFFFLAVDAALTVRVTVRGAVRVTLPPRLYPSR